MSTVLKVPSDFLFNLLATAESAGATSEDLTKLTQAGVFAKILPILCEGVEEYLVKHIIDCDSNPYLPDGWSVEEHQKGGQLEWDPEKIQLWLSKSQKDGGYIEGNKLRKELKSQSVLNANVLDYLLANPHLIPEEWKGKYVYFWGTIYRSRSGNLIVRCLYWGGDKWIWGYGWLDDGWGDRYPAVVCK